MSTVTAYRQLAASMSETLARTARTPEVRREIDYYLSRIGQIKNVEDFMSDERLLRFALKSFGLEDMSYAKAFIRRVVIEGVDRTDSLANKLADKRFRTFASTFNFPRYGDTTTSFARARHDVVDAYVRTRVEVDAGTKNEALRLALYFQREAPKVTSAYGLLADRALLKVTQVMLGIPEASGRIDIDRQKAMIEAKLDLTDLRSPAAMDKLLTRFTALWDINSPAPANTTLIGPTSRAAAVPIDLLAALQTSSSRR